MKPWLTFNPGLAPISFRTTGPRSAMRKWWVHSQTEKCNYFMNKSATQVTYTTLIFVVVFILLLTHVLICSEHGMMLLSFLPFYCQSTNKNRIIHCKVKVRILTTFEKYLSNVSTKLWMNSMMANSFWKKIKQTNKQKKVMINYSWNTGLN